MQKKFFTVLLSAITLLGAFGCSKKENEPVNIDPDEQKIDYGTLTLENVEVTFMSELILNPVFSKEEYEEKVTYTFDGNAIEINDGKVKGLIPNSDTTVKAKTSHHETTFDVHVNYIEASLTSPTGGESKYAVKTPDASITNYVLHFHVSAIKYVNEYTRLSSFAFNASDNSWYNIEMDASGNMHLFARFNGVEKYWIYLGNKADYIVENNIEYDVDILRNGQATTFYFNSKAVCGFTEKEMEGYASLATMEVTAAADRENAGEYVINLSKVYYELENTGSYQELLNTSTVNFDDFTLAHEQGDEQKYRYGYIANKENMLFSSVVDVEKWDNNATRPVAFAFNGSDNSWYNIEMNAEGALNLFARFNGVEKYWIYLGNKSELMVNDKIHFEINILKEG